MNFLDVSPRQAINDPINGFPANTVLLCKEPNVASRVAFADSLHLGIGKFCASICLALTAILTGLASFRDHILNVCIGSTDEKVGWVATLAIVAPMTNEMPFRDCPKCQFKSNAMRAEHYVFLRAQHAVSAVVDVRLPFPAFITAAPKNAPPKSFWLLQHRRPMPLAILPAFAANMNRLELSAATKTKGVVFHADSISSRHGVGV